MTENLLQERINELSSAIVNFESNKTHITGFYNEKMLLSHLESHKRNYLSIGLYETTLVNFSNIKDDALFLVQEDGKTISKHQYRVIFKDRVQRSKGASSLLLTVREHQFLDQWQIVMENQCIEFETRSELKSYLSEHFRTDFEFLNQ
ncbi:hypothetical protein QT711_00215 [Sporosarcina saromensis]|uniref:Uncharacterized protein n=1 Tax=Sporosarcina saromensis TaxID=359365 RepID=A0ABU4G3N6_9BACL|nr:hypothetical protein [Sporosarcina saromensis]MDW0111585.1 hypothetical protein [Sporosarcina saromensis]